MSSRENVLIEKFMAVPGWWGRKIVPLQVRIWQAGKEYLPQLA